MAWAVVPRFCFLSSPLFFDRDFRGRSQLLRAGESMAVVPKRAVPLSSDENWDGPPAISLGSDTGATDLQRGGHTASGRLKTRHISVNRGNSL